MIGELLQALTLLVPWWVLAIVGGLAAMLLSRGWLEGLRIKRVKSCLRRMVRADDALRAELVREVLALSDGRAEVLVALVREADKMNQPALRDRALASLKALGTHRDVVRQLEAPADRTQDRRFGHPVEALVAIEALLEAGATEAARARLDEASARFPRDPGLRDLRERLKGQGHDGSGEPPSAPAEPPATD